jgi:hypothetical protein
MRRTIVWLGVIAAAASSAGCAPPLDAQLKEQIQFPAFRPPVTALVVGKDSTVWVRRERIGSEDIAWDVLDWSGRPIGRLEAPLRLKVWQAQRGALWGTLADEDGVPYVIRYRVVTE